MTYKTWDTASHFCCKDQCRWGKTTLLGPVFVSSIGECADPMLLGGRQYETMVFRANGVCENPECNCGGLPLQLDGSELACRRADSVEECLTHHDDLVREFEQRIAAGDL